MDRAVIEAGLPEVLRAARGQPALVVERVDARHDPAAEAGQPWLAVKYGGAGANDWHGVVPVSVRLRPSPAAPAEDVALVVKVNPRRGVGDTLIPWIIEREGIELPRPFDRWRTTTESRDTGDREAAVYALAGSVPELAAAMARCHGRIDDPGSGEHALVLEWVELDGLDASGARLDWPHGRLVTAAAAAARWHAALASRTPDLGWAGSRPTTADRVADLDLYRALLVDAHRRFPDDVDDAVLRRRERLLDTLHDWHAVKDELPATLVHDDFNARNVGFAGERAVVLDWELARLDTPTRDPVELLTFGLGPDADPEVFTAVSETARATLAAGGLTIDAGTWREAVRAEVRTEAIDRLAMQAVFAAAFTLPYFSRIQATVERMLDLTD
jgi:hypothetical protein